MVVSVKARGWKSFLELIGSVESTTELDELMQALLTHEERNQLALRVELIRELLYQQKPQRQIASELGISIATITRGSNMLKSIKHKVLVFLKERL
jgi:TrpR family trp operon transcriptional repressor